MLMTTIITNTLSPVTLSQECATKSSAFNNKIKSDALIRIPSGVRAQPVCSTRTLPGVSDTCQRPAFFLIA